MELKPEKLPEYATFNEIVKQFCPDPKTQAEKDDRIQRRNLWACRAKIKEIIVQACRDGELRCEGVIGGWRHSFLEPNPYPRSRPGYVNKFPELTYQEFKQNDWLHKSYRLRQHRHDSQGREYGYVYYRDEHITIQANEFRRWFSQNGKRLINNLFDLPVKPIDNWWGDEPEAETIEQDETNNQIQPRNEQRDNYRTILLGAALDQMEAENKKTPGPIELAAFVLSAEFKHPNIQKTTHTGKGSLDDSRIQDRTLHLTDGTTLDKQKIFRCYRETIYKNPR